MTIRSGRNGAYFWLTSVEHTLGGLLESCPEVVVSRRVAITAFDSGPLQLMSEELEQGWEQRGNIAVSPIVNEPSILPHEGYDEWYAFQRDIPEFGDVEVFVNYGGFSPVTLAEGRPR